MKPGMKQPRVWPWRYRILVGLWRVLVAVWMIVTRQPHTIPARMAKVVSRVTSQARGIVLGFVGRSRTVK